MSTDSKDDSIGLSDIENNITNPKTIIRRFSKTAEELKADLIQLVAKEIGAIAKPDIIQWAPGLPKTRSGKIMRRILRKIASNEIDNLGDTTTLADPSVVEELIINRENR